VLQCHILIKEFFFERDARLIPCNYIVVYLVMPKHVQ